MSDDIIVGRKEILKYMVKLWSIMAILTAIVTVLLHATSDGSWIGSLLLSILPVYFLTLIGESVYQKRMKNE